MTELVRADIAALAPGMLERTGFPIRNWQGQNRGWLIVSALDDWGEPSLETGAGKGHSPSWPELSLRHWHMA